MVVFTMIQMKVFSPSISLALGLFFHSTIIIIIITDLTRYTCSGFNIIIIFLLLLLSLSSLLLWWLSQWFDVNRTGELIHTQKHTHQNGGEWMKQKRKKTNNRLHLFGYDNDNKNIMMVFFLFKRNIEWIELKTKREWLKYMMMMMMKNWKTCSNSFIKKERERHLIT